MLSGLFFDKGLMIRLFDLAEASFLFAFSVAFMLDYRCRHIEAHTDEISRTLRAAMKNSKTFDAFRIDIEKRLEQVEQEQERWPKMLASTLTIVPLGVASLMALVKLADMLLTLFLRHPKP